MGAVETKWATGINLGATVVPVDGPGCVIAEISNEVSPPLVQPWPEWFARLVALGALVKARRDSGSDSQKIFFLALALPTRRLAAAAIALGLVASSTSSEPFTSRALRDNDFDGLEHGQTLRITKTFVVGGQERVSTQTAHFDFIKMGRSGERELVVDTVAGGRERAATFRLGQGNTKFEAITLPLGLHEQAIDTQSNRLSSWLAPGAGLVDFHASIHNELRWVGERTRIEHDIAHGVARGHQDLHSDVVKVSDLLRIRDGDGLTGRGWHTHVMPTVSEAPHDENYFGAANFTILDGNRAVYRHLNVVASRINICLLDAGSGPRLNDAVRSLESRSRWGEQLPVGALVPWVPPIGVDAVAFSMEAAYA